MNYTDPTLYIACLLALLIVLATPLGSEPWI